MYEWVGMGNIKVVRSPDAWQAPRRFTVWCSVVALSHGFAHVAVGKFPHVHLVDLVEKHVDLVVFYDDAESGTPAEIRVVRPGG